MAETELEIDEVERLELDEVAAAYLTGYEDGWHYCRDFMRPATDTDNQSD